MKPLARMTKAERFATVAPFNGQVVRVRYRTARHAPPSYIVARCIGAAEHRTNGTSSGELVLVPISPTHSWIGGDGPYKATIVALNLVESIGLAGAGQLLAAVGNETS